MAVTLAAARRLGAIHHCLKPTGHVHLQHLVTPDEIMLLDEGDAQRNGDVCLQLSLGKFWLFCQLLITPDWWLTSSWWYFGLFLWSFVRLWRDMHMKWCCNAWILKESVLVWDLNSPVFDKGLEVKGEAHAERQQRRIFLQHFGQNLKVCLAVLVGKLSRGQLHLQDPETQMWGFVAFLSCGRWLTEYLYLWINNTSQDHTLIHRGLLLYYYYSKRLLITDVR